MIENMGVEVVCLSADVGQEGTLEGNRDKALGAGAIAYEELDLREEFASDFLAPVIKANALYEQQYPLVSALSRPLIVKHQVELARKYGADGHRPRLHRQGERPGPLRGVRHGPGSRPGAPGSRAQLGFHPRGLDPLRRPSTASPSSATKEKLYSIDDNLWGRAIECGEMEDPWAAPTGWRLEDDDPDRHRADGSVLSASNAACRVALDGEADGAARADRARSTHLVGSYGWGRLDMVENRRVGIKSRETYEAPGALAVMLAHADLESITLERDLQREKIAPGAPLRGAGLRRAVVLAAARGARRVRGHLPGAVSPVRCACASNPGRASSTDGGRRESLYDYGLATYDAADRFRHADSEGFVRLWGLGVQTWSGIQGPGSR